LERNQIYAREKREERFHRALSKLYPFDDQTNCVFKDANASRQYPITQFLESPILDFMPITRDSRAMISWRK